MWLTSWLVGLFVLLLPLSAGLRGVSPRRGPWVLSKRSQQAETSEGDTSEATRVALVRLIEDSWQRVSQLTTKPILRQCEEELRSATGLLVLATARRSAERSAASRTTLQSMFRQADVNNDGQLTYTEWFDWLGAVPPPLDGAGSGTGTATGAASSAAPFAAPTTPSSDPMIVALSQVLSQAVCSLKIAARIPENQSDPLALTAAFIAGGIMAGTMDGDVCRTMLSRLSPRTRELVTLALALEGASLSSAFSDGGPLFPGPRPRSGGRGRAKERGGSRPAAGCRGWALPNSVAAGRRQASSSASSTGAAATTAAAAAAAATKASSLDVIQIVDLSSVRVAVAPDIDAPVQGGDGGGEDELRMLNLALDEAAADAEGESEGEREGAEEDGEEAEMLEPRVMDSRRSPGQPLGSRAEGDADPPAAAASASADSSSSGSSGEADDLDAVLARVSSISREVSALRTSLQDLEDGPAAQMRQLLTRQAGGRRDVLALAMTLRAARLQHVSAMPTVLRHQMAVETLQLWAPLSFQLGVSGHMPELEVLSYVLLFPRSFNSFVNWYTQLNPIAKRLLANFREALEERLQSDALMPHLAQKVTLQSRFKNPSSAFKKMVKSSKQKQQLHDMLGMRVIVTERAMDDGWETEGGGERQGQGASEGRGEGREGKSGVDVPGAAGGTAEPQRGEGDEGDEGDEGGAAAPEAAPLSDPDPDLEGEGEGEGWEALGGGDASYWADFDQEETAVWRVYALLGTIPGWTEDKRRFKDYIRRPKASGYQSLHATLVHADTRVSMEVQLRSRRMHDVAETGPASHNRYKALLLPGTEIDMS